MPSDVFVDYTSASVKGRVLAAIAAHRHVVIGGSGCEEPIDVRSIKVLPGRERGHVAAFMRFKPS